MVSQDGNSSVGHVTCYPWSCDSSYWSTSGNIKEWSSDDVPSWMWNVFSLWRHWRTNILFMSCALLPNMFGSNDTLKTGKALHIYILIQIPLQNSGLFWIRQTQVSYRGNHVRSNILSYPNTLVEFPTEVSVSASCLTMSKKTEWNRQNTEAAVCGDSSETTDHSQPDITHCNSHWNTADLRLCSSPHQASLMMVFQGLQLQEWTFHWSNLFLTENIS